MKRDTFIFSTAADRLLLKAACVQDELDQIKLLALLAELCCDECDCVFSGEVGEA